MSVRHWGLPPPPLTGTSYRFALLSEVSRRLVAFTARRGGPRRVGARRTQST
jgi:hypothetical protein